MRKEALVTGGTRGIGLGVAQALARTGFDLALCGTRPPEDQAVLASVQAVKDCGAERVEYFQCDIGDRAARHAMLDGLKSRCGRLDLLVNNAGIAPAERKDILDAGEESFEKLLRVNLQGPYFLTQQTARWMIEQGKASPDFKGMIINVTSVSATMASLNRGEYCVSKAGLGMATTLWALRLAEYGIPVYELRPGIIQTDMTAGVKEKYDTLIKDGLVPQRRWGTPEDIGKAVASLAKGDLPYSTGTVLMVDGGLSLPHL